jgi:hypothetical protein
LANIVRQERKVEKPAAALGGRKETKLAQNRTGGGMNNRPFVLVLVLGMKSGNSGECGSRFGLGQIFVAFQADRDPDLGIFMARGVGRIRRTIGRGRGPDDAQNMAAAAYRHAIAEGNFGGHAKGKFDCGAFGERGAGEKEDAARAEILSESDALDRGSGLTKGERKKVREPLSDTAFNSNWRGGHVACLPLPNRRKRRRYFSSRREIREAANGQNSDLF